MRGYSPRWLWWLAYLEGSLVVFGANETVVPASGLQKSMKRIKQLEGALGRKTLEKEILKEAVNFAKAKKGIARSPVLPGDEQWGLCVMSLACRAAHVLAKKHRSSDWADRRKSPQSADDTQVKKSIADLLHKRATYGYRRIWARL